MSPLVKSFFDKATWTFSYVVSDPSTLRCVIIDPVLNYDAKSGRTSTQSADELIEYITNENLKLEWLLETHAHADHVTAAYYLKHKLGGKTAIGEHISSVQSVFKQIFNLGLDFSADGSQFNDLLKDGQQISFGSQSITCRAVPGHTPACVAYEIGDALFVGDTLFLPDVGTARCDFPGGDARQLFQSIKKILSYPDDTKLYMCHDYPPAGRMAQCQTTVAQQRSSNIHIHDGVSQDDFVLMRTTRDKTLDMPALILPSIQINIRAGNMPASEPNGTSYLKIPLNAL